ncbi:MAG TPA: adenylate/guanylate cyclase domain-containing protein [Nitrososphaerales archaeon]|nr:adenylate/guanylate cyclase domain-containing protein [Nitrososphaerales archaeon]
MSETVRRLAAVVFTDIVGYTALTQRDESLALSLLEKHNSLVRSVVVAHRGREIKTIGDAFLLEFDSTFEAVICAVEIQRAFWEQNRNSPEHERVFLRIGVHVGDVVFQNNDIYGDAVNIASRIEHYAEAGGVCISEQVYSQIKNKLRYPVLKLPQQRLKNVEPKTDLYLIVLPWVREEKESKSADPRNRIAVLPFSNISPDPNDAYLSDGLTEELISTLSEIKELRVIARTSVNRFKGVTNKDAAEMGQELQVSFILEGSVRKIGNKIRVAIQLIDVATQEHLWSNQYDRNLDDVFLIQSDIAKSVADSLKLTLLAREQMKIEEKGTENLAAYVAYLKGRSLLHDRSETAIRGAKEQFEIAVKEDPSYALAYAGLADIHMLLGDYLLSPIPESLEEAKSYIKKALELDPDIAEARVSLAEELIYEYKFREAEQQFRRAISLNPSYATAHHWYANCLATLGLKDKSFSEMMLAEELDPLSSIITVSAVYVCLEVGDFESAQKRLRKLVEIDPSSPLVNEGFMVYHFGRREWEEAMRYIEKMRKEDPNDPYLDADMAYIYAITGRKKEALELIEKVNREIPETAGTKYSLIAFVYSAFDDLDECFKWLDRAYKAREVFYGWFRQYPIFENVRKDPRFNELLKKVDLL